MSRYYIRNWKNSIQHIFESYENRVILSNPSITPFEVSKNRQFESDKDIMYYYYDFEIQQREGLWDSKKLKMHYKWKTVSHIRVFEDGIVENLPDFLRNILNYNMLCSSNKKFYHRNSNTDFDVIYYDGLSGFCGEDNLSIEKHYRYFKSSYNQDKDCNEEKNCEWYNVYFGCGGLRQMNTIGVMFEHLEKDDICNIILWAEGFIQDSVDLTKENIKNNYSEWCEDED